MIHTYLDSAKLTDSENTNFKQKNHSQENAKFFDVSLRHEAIENYLHISENTFPKKASIGQNLESCHYKLQNVPVIMPLTLTMVNLCIQVSYKNECISVHVLY